MEPQMQTPEHNTQSTQRMPQGHYTGHSGHSIDDAVDNDASGQPKRIDVSKLKAEDAKGLIYSIADAVADNAKKNNADFPHTMLGFYQTLTDFIQKELGYRIVHQNPNAGRAAEEAQQHTAQPMHEEIPQQYGRPLSARDMMFASLASMDRAYERFEKTLAWLNSLDFSKPENGGHHVPDYTLHMDCAQGMEMRRRSQEPSAEPYDAEGQDAEQYSDADTYSPGYRMIAYGFTDRQGNKHSMPAIELVDKKGETQRYLLTTPEKMHGMGKMVERMQEKFNVEYDKIIDENKKAVDGYNSLAGEYRKLLEENKELKAAYDLGVKAENEDIADKLDQMNEVYDIQLKEKEGLENERNGLAQEKEWFAEMAAELRKSYMAEKFGREKFQADFQRADGEYIELARQNEELARKNQELEQEKQFLVQHLCGNTPA